MNLLRRDYSKNKWTKVNKLSNNSEIIDNINLLFALKSVMRHLGWYLLNGVMSKSAGSKISVQINDTIKKLSPHSLTICHAFGVPKQQLIAPMYTGYQEYYKSDKTQGEHYYKPKF